MIYEFQASQSYNGYDKPWAPGAGKNLADYPGMITAGAVEQTDGSLYVATSQSFSGIKAFQNDGTSGQFSITFIVKNDSTSRGVYPVVKYTDGTSENVPVGGGFTTFTTVTKTTNPEKTVDNINFSYGSQGVKTWFYIQVETGATPTAWTPYANICMPEGFSIWDPEAQDYTQVYAGYVNANTRELHLRPVYEEYAGEELVGPWMSSYDPYEEDTTPTEGAFVIDFGGELTGYEITPFMLQTLLDSLGIRQHFTNGAGLLNSLMDQAQGRVRSEEELLHLSRPLNVIAIGDQLPVGLTFKPISKDVLPGLPGKFIR